MTQVIPLLYSHQFWFIFWTVLVAIESVGSLDGVGGYFYFFKEEPSSCVEFILIKFEGRHVVFEVFAHFIKDFWEYSALDKQLTALFILWSVDEGICLTRVSVHIDKAYEVLSIFV